MARTLHEPLFALLDMDLWELAFWFEEAQNYEKARADAMKQNASS